MIAMCRVKPEATAFNGIMPLVRAGLIWVNPAAEDSTKHLTCSNFCGFFLLVRVSQENASTVKWVFPSLETCLSLRVSWEKVSIPKHPPAPYSRGKDMLDKMRPPITWKTIRTSLLNLLIILMSKEQMHPHPLLRPLWMFPASKTVYKLFLHHIHKNEILNSVKWRSVDCSQMDQRHSYMYHWSLWWVRRFNPHEGGWMGLFSVCLILYESIVEPIYGRTMPSSAFQCSIINLFWRFTKDGYEKTN